MDNWSSRLARHQGEASVHSGGLPGISAIIGSAERLSQATRLRANATLHELALAALGLDRDAHQST